MKSWKLNFRSRALFHCTMYLWTKTYQCLQNHTTRRFNYKPKLCQNVALSLNGLHLNIPSPESWTLCRAASSSGTAWVGNAWARSLASWAILSISGSDYTTGPHQTYDILISSQSRHSPASKMTSVQLLISLHNNRHLFADGFATVGPIALEFGWD